MEIGLFRNFAVQVKQNEETRKFVKELEGALESHKLPKKQTCEEIFEDIKNKKNVSIVAKNEIQEEISKMLANYANEKITKEIKNKINQIKENVLEKQNKILENYREEGHLYIVEENINDRIFLSDITTRKKYSIEEVAFPEELKVKATEGAVFRYINGKYEFYSDDGFERIYKNAN